MKVMVVTTRTLLGFAMGVRLYLEWDQEKVGGHKVMSAKGFFQGVLFPRREKERV
jgi:hypothetical protein